MLIVVAGAIANTAGKGGDTWHRLHWLLGLRQLGVTVQFVEQIAPALVTPDASAPAASPPCVDYFTSVLGAFKLLDAATLLTTDGESIVGAGREAVRGLLNDADVFVNISGHLDWQALGANPRRAVFVDEDPGFTQMWHATGALGNRLAGYDFYYSVGANVGTARAALPGGDIPWRTLRPFAVLSEWPLVDQPRFDRFTTVGGWRGPFGALEYEGRRYGVKAHEFRKFIELPQRAPYPFELALDIHPADAADVQNLHDHGWQIVDPLTAAASPDAFRAYVQGSGAEFSVAKEMYVATNSGWFSDRTIRYLASGRPAVVQDTGWQRCIPVSSGLLAFRSIDQAVAACEQVVRGYAEQSDAARQVAEDYFASGKVLGRLLEELEGAK